MPIHDDADDSIGRDVDAGEMIKTGEIVSWCSRCGEKFPLASLILITQDNSSSVEGSMLICGKCYKEVGHLPPFVVDVTFKVRVSKEERLRIEHGIFSQFPDMIAREDGDGQHVYRLPGLGNPRSALRKLGKLTTWLTIVHARS